MWAPLGPNCGGPGGKGPGGSSPEGAEAPEGPKGFIVPATEGSRVKGVLKYKGR